MAAETLRRHIRTLLLRQRRRCGVALADCCCGNRGVEATFADCRCGSRDVAASHSQTAVVAAETLRRHIRRLLLRQQRRCSVTSAFAVYAASALVVDTSHQLLRRSQRRACVGAHRAHAGHLLCGKVHLASSCKNCALAGYAVPASVVEYSALVLTEAVALPSCAQRQRQWRSSSRQCLSSLWRWLQP